MNSWYETFLILFIVAGFAVAIWKGGSANPESTGSLGRKMAALTKTVTKLQGQVSTVQQDVSRLEADSASASDIERLEEAVQSLKVKVSEIGESAAGRNATLEHVKQQVDRLYNVIVEKGMSK